LPADVQMYGVIHGGNLLRFIEEAGDIVATTYCNRYVDDDKKLHLLIAALASVEQSDFIHSVKLGSKLEAEAQVIYTSKRSLQVIVNVWNADVFKKNSRKLCHRSVLWYVPLDLHDATRSVSVKPLSFINLELHSKAHTTYVAKKAQRKPRPSALIFDPDFCIMPKQNVECSSSYIINPEHCGLGHYCKGGVLLKWMDEITGGYATTYCGIPCVTASVDTCEFYWKIPLGSYITISVVPVFYSKRTIELRATAYLEQLGGERVAHQIVADAFFTFAMVGNSNETVPAFFPKTEEDKQLFEIRKRRYEQRKTTTKSL